MKISLTFQFMLNRPYRVLHRSEKHAVFASPAELLRNGELYKKMISRL